jgi:hypothetical protein
MYIDHITVTCSATVQAMLSVVRNTQQHCTAVTAAVSYYSICQTMHGDVAVCLYDLHVFSLNSAVLPAPS